ncbi:MAG: choice-of-anchor A family protein [Isosphaeraceae bacterium]|nr:choice-of-anchor A family protein [Isosphaeraceae bacterium]
MFRKTLGLICVLGAGLSPSARADMLGPAQNYNVFVLGSDSESNTDSQGPVAVGGNAVFQNYSVASSRSTVTPDALVVGGDLNYTNGTVNGDLHVGGTASLSGVTVTGSQFHDTPINFAAAGSSLVAESTYLNGLTATGSVGSGTLGLTLTGSNAALNVFQLSATQFASANNNGLNIVVPNGSTAVINVAGSSPSLANFQMYVNGSSSESNAQINKILFNFAGATSLSDSNVAIYGSVLAPSAALSFGYSHIDGTLIGASLTGNVEAHDYPFTGNLPPAPVPEPSSVVLLALGGCAVAFVSSKKRRRRDALVA